MFDQRRKLKEELGMGGRSAPPAKVFLSRGDAARMFINKLCKWWVKRAPHEVRRYEREVKELREGLRNGTGVSAEKSIAQVGVIPIRVYMLAEQIVPGFWNDGGADLWFREFPAFASRTRKAGYFKGGKVS